MNAISVRSPSNKHIPNFLSPIISNECFNSRQYHMAPLISGTFLKVIMYANRNLFSIYVIASILIKLFIHFILMSAHFNNNNKMDLNVCGFVRQFFLSSTDYFHLAYICFFTKITLSIRRRKKMVERENCLHPI